MVGCQRRRKPRSTRLSQLAPHNYRVISVPDGCTNYSVDDEVEMYVAEPPPTQIVLGGSDPCAGTAMALIE